nr:ribosome assembly RNA-binding protein YhbY [Cellulosilyticum ruminicola]
MTITSKQRSYLKSLAQKIDSIFQIGKNGLTPEVTEAIDLALEAREIVKISVLQNCLEDPRDIAGMLSERTKSITVQVIGKKIVLYRPSKKNPKITL